MFPYAHFIHISQAIFTGRRRWLYFQQLPRDAKSQTPSASVTVSRLCEYFYLPLDIYGHFLFLRDPLGGGGGGGIGTRIFSDAKNTSAVVGLSPSFPDRVDAIFSGKLVRLFEKYLPVGRPCTREATNGGLIRHSPICKASRPRERGGEDLVGERSAGRKASPKGLAIRQSCVTQPRPGTAVSPLPAFAHSGTIASR